MHGKWKESSQVARKKDGKDWGQIKDVDGRREWERRMKQKRIRERWQRLKCEQ